MGPGPCSEACQGWEVGSRNKEHPEEEAKTVEQRSRPKRGVKHRIMMIIMLKILAWNCRTMTDTKWGLAEDYSLVLLNEVGTLTTRKGYKSLGRKDAAT